MVALKPVEPKPPDPTPASPPAAEPEPVVVDVEDRFEENLEASASDPRWPPPLPGHKATVLMVCTKSGRVTVYGEATGNPYFFQAGIPVPVDPRDVPGLKAKRRSAYASSRGEARFFIEKE